METTETANNMKYNDINMKQWRTYDNIITNSVWNKEVDYIEQICKRYSQSNDLVLDVFTHSDNSKNIIEGLNRKYITISKETEIKHVQDKKVQLIIINADDDRIFNNYFQSEEFLSLSKDCIKSLEQDRFLIFITSDYVTGDKYYLSGFECAGTLSQLGLNLRTMAIQETKLKAHPVWRYRALQKGFNLITHKYIFIFQKV